MPGDPLTWLFALEQFGIKLGLDNIRALVAALGHPERTFRSIHVAGTNGKGSITAMLDAMLRAAGVHVGRYTSPHIVDLTERFAIEGRPVAEATLRQTMNGLRTRVENLVDEGALAGPPTFFEVTTAAAFELFRQAGVDVAVCEVGLGGRLDATNVLLPDVAVISTIGYDHQQHLGTGLRDIAGEKAGIIKPGVPVVVGALPPEARDVVEKVALRVGAPVVHAFDGVTLERRPGAAPPDGTRMSLTTPVRDYGELFVRLAGEHQVANAVVAIRAIEAFQAVPPAVAVPPAAIRAGLAGVGWPARLELRRLRNGRELLLDAAHNAEGAAALAAFLARMAPERLPLVFGVSRDKDADAMLGALMPVVSSLVCTRASSPRSADPGELASRARSLAPSAHVTVEPSPAAALELAWRSGPRIAVGGSIFLLGDVLIALGET